ncbi:MAG: hypothetical protein RLZZ219_1670 [Cyanobacteriota bacterium]
MSTAVPCSAEVVVVDDDARIRALLEDELHARGLSALLCSSVHDLLQLLQNRSPQLVLLGVRGSDPQQLKELRLLRGDRLELPVVVLSADADATIPERAIASGAREVVLKRDLLMRLPQLLAHHLGIETLPEETF